MFDFIKKGKDKAKGAAMRALMKKQLAQVPEAQREKILSAFEKNPEVFEKISKQIQHKMKHEGKSQMAASMEVMKNHQAELQKLFNQ
jgi:hypothetical protein